MVVFIDRYNTLMIRNTHRDDVTKRFYDYC